MLDDIGEHKKVNRNVIARIRHNECKDVSLNNKCIRHSMNTIQRKTETVKTVRIWKFSGPYSVRMRGSTDQKISNYGYFSCSEDHRIGIYEINKISLSCFDDKIYV